MTKETAPLEEAYQRAVTKAPPLTGPEKELAQAFKTAPEPPDGFNAKMNPPPSGFVDEPDMYEEAHVKGREAKEITVVVDPNQAEVVGVLDVEEEGVE